MAPLIWAQQLGDRWLVLPVDDKKHSEPLIKVSLLEFFLQILRVCVISHLFVDLLTCFGTKYNDFKAHCFKWKDHIHAQKHCGCQHDGRNVCLKVVAGGFPDWLALFCTVTVKPPWQPKLWHTKLVTVKTFSSCWPSSQRRKRFKGVHNC